VARSNDRSLSEGASGSEACSVVDDPAVGAVLDRLNPGSETADPKAFGGTVEIVASGKVQRIKATRYAGTPVHPRRNAAVLTKVNRCMNIVGADAYAERILGALPQLKLVRTQHCFGPQSSRRQRQTSESDPMLHPLVSVTVRRDTMVG
jgi:hypothetical protein